MRRALLALALALVVPSVAQAGGGSVTGRLGPAPKHAVVWLEGVPASAWTVPKESETISQRGAQFRPDFVVVTVGQTVQMPNDDKIAHNVFSMSPPKKFDLGHYRQGESRQVTFDKPGVVDLFCNIHENMHATLVVAPSTFFAVTDSEGKFTIAGVPPGTYKVVVYSPDAGGATGSVTVAEGAPATVALKLKAGK